MLVVGFALLLQKDFFKTDDLLYLFFLALSQHGSILGNQRIKRVVGFKLLDCVLKHFFWLGYILMILKRGQHNLDFSCLLSIVCLSFSLLPYIVPFSDIVLLLLTVFHILCDFLQALYNLNLLLHDVILHCWNLALESFDRFYFSSFSGLYGLHCIWAAPESQKRKSVLILYLFSIFFCYFVQSKEQFFTVLQILLSCY